jgi:hypothetical protein
MDEGSYETGWRQNMTKRRIKEMGPSMEASEA